MSTATPLPQLEQTTADVVATNIRALAAAQGFNQVQLGRALGLKQNAITTRWRGERPWQLHELDTVAAVLGVSVADLVTPDTLNPRQWITPTGAAARSKGLEPPTF